MCYFCKNIFDTFYAKEENCIFFQKDKYYLSFSTGGCMEINCCPICGKSLRKKTTKNKNDSNIVTDNNTNDNVNHPSHYNSGNIEVIDFIESLGLGKDFCLGNAIKYISRAGRKDPTKKYEDLRKAKWYLDRVVENLEDD